MIRSRVRDDLERVRELPFFPALPLVPIALFVGNLVLLALVYRKVSRIERSR
jgi:hypothetical protein